MNQTQHENGDAPDSITRLKDQIKQLTKERDEEKQIVDRVWAALGISTYEQARPLSIDEHVLRLMKERDEAQAKCAYFLLILERLLRNLLANEHPEILHSLPPSPSPGQVLNNPSEGKEDSPQQVQGMCCRDNEGKGAGPGNEEEAGRIVAPEEKIRPGEVQEISGGLSKESSGKEPIGLSETKPIQGEMQDSPEECGCRREGGEAESVSGMQVGGLPTCSSRRLQQTVQSAVALCYLSRQEAQEILEPTDCVKGWKSPEEYAALEAKCANMRCNECEGTGRVSDLDAIPPMANPTPNWDTKICQECSGTGVASPPTTPNASLPPLATGPTRKMLIEILVSADFEKRLDNQWEVEREIHADRWKWTWGELSTDSDLYRQSKALIDFLGKNAGETADWPIDLLARDEEAANKLKDLLDGLEKALVAQNQICTTKKF